MNDNWKEIRDFIFDYNLVDRNIGFVLIETIIVAFFVGSITNVGWGVGAFIFMLLLYGIPLIGGVFTFTFSFVESLLIGWILSKTEMSLGWIYFVGVIAFIVLTQVHMTFGAIDNHVLMGYSLIIFCDLLIGLALYSVYENFSIVIIAFIAVLVIAFIPGLRIFELIVLSIGTAAVAYGISYSSLGIWKALFFALFVLIYSGSLFYHAYAGVDYAGMVKSKKRQKVQAENNSRLYQIKSDLYARFPELEKNYYYFYTEVCNSEFAKIQFDHDWDNYLKYLDETSNIVSFNEYFEQEKLYRTSHYNTDFAKGHKDWEVSRKGDKDAENQTFLPEQNTLSSESQQIEEKLIYSLDKISLFALKDKFWDSDIEKKIYLYLRSFIDDAYIILPHVAFREIFRWEWSYDWRLTDRVTKMHFDFGIYNADLKSIFFIEINGKDHEKPEEMERDIFRTELMKHVGKKLIVIKYIESMTDQEIRDKLIECIKNEIPDRHGYSAYCPRCGNLMKIRLNNKTGEFFYGCCTYSKEKTNNCPGVSLETIPPLYIGIPTVKEKN